MTFLTKVSVKFQLFKAFLFLLLKQRFLNLQCLLFFAILIYEKCEAQTLHSIKYTTCLELKLSNPFQPLLSGIQDNK